MKKLVLAIAVVLVLSLVSTVQAQNSLTVRVNGLEDSKGKLMIALFDSEETFLTSKACNGKSVTVVGTSSEFIFENLKAGDYAIALFQDSNDNNRLDLDESMIPMEIYGFSNNVDPAVVKRQPVFSECKFALRSNQEIVINAVRVNKEK